MSIEKQAMRAFAEARKAKHLSTDELGVISGVGRDVIANMESGRLKVLGIDRFLAIAGALGLQAKVELYQTTRYIG